MRITIENTDEIIDLSGVPARLWIGKTEKGIEVHCFVTRISPQANEKIEEFEKELQETPPPKHRRIYPLSLIL